MKSRSQHNRPMTDWMALKQWLVYVPGAVIMLYGFWLSLTV